VRAETGLARGIVAQASGESVEALFNYTQAITFDRGQIEALARLGAVTSSISGGTISQRIVSDLQAYDRWLGVFRDTSRFFEEHPPFEIRFDPNLTQHGETDYARRTATVAMRVVLAPSEAGFDALNALLAGLERTGRRGVWGFDGGPLLPTQPKTEGTLVFGGERDFSFRLEASLLNENGKTLGRGVVTLESELPLFSAGDKAVSLPPETFALLRFPDIRAEDLTPSLTIVINAVNGIPAQTLSATGYMCIEAAELEAKFAAEQKAQVDAVNARLAAEREREKQAQAEKLRRSQSLSGRFTTGVLNILLGLGSYLDGDIAGGLIITLGYAAAAGLCAYETTLNWNDSMVGVPGTLGLSLAGVTAFYGLFIRPYIYSRSPQTAAIVDNVGLTMVSTGETGDKRGEKNTAALRLSYTVKY
jgi:hypothetical protein